MDPFRAGLKRRSRKIRMILMDVDGVMTRGGIILGSRGFEMKIFDVQDGMGVTLARMGGLKTGIITGRQSDVVRRRAEELRMDVIVQGRPDKLPAFEDILDKHRLQQDQVAYIGDDLLDRNLLIRAGLAVAPANARPEIRRAAHYITRSSGGCGAVREVVEMILKFQNTWKRVVNQVYMHSLDKGSGT